MSKYKVCVYAICKNEEAFVERFYESMKEADSIYVLDTGSSDNTVSKLKEKGIVVKEEVINPWRFDVARNKSLEMVPIDTDICVCTDLDEVFNKGWRKELEKVWKDDLSFCRYIYNWKLVDNKPIVSFYYEKIHKRKGVKWIYPVHEIIEYSDKAKYVVNDDIVLNHYPDPTKSRSCYLNLLKQSVIEYPLSDRNRHYLGREYMYHGMYNEAIDTLISHLNMETSTWKDERCASMRFIGRCYKYLLRYEEANMWLNKAIKEAPHLKDPYMEMGLLQYEIGNYKELEYYLKEALKINTNYKTYINESFSNDQTCCDLLSIACFNQEKYAEALTWINKAITYSDEIRLLNNKKLIEKKMNL